MPIDLDDREMRVRLAAKDWLDMRSDGGRLPISGMDLRNDFYFHGERIPLMTQGGIWKPAWMSAALTFRTTYTADGKTAPYDDRPGPDGLPRYKWRGTDPNQADNRALRSAMQQRLPLVWLIGVPGNSYVPITDVYLVAEDPANHEFTVDPGIAHAQGLRVESALEEMAKRYLVRMTKQRLHQPVFRANVIHAYRRRCAVCNFGHPELLDAAHIVPDSDDAGIAAVRNGMSMCKIHHAAFDAGFLGVRPDLVVQIRQDLLDEIDGPMLQHGLQGRHGQRLMAIPSRVSDRPDSQLLSMAYQRFRDRSGVA